MNNSNEIMAKKLKKIEELPHISSEEFCKDMDGILERVSKEQIAYVITQNAKSDIVACPIEWFDVRYDEDFQAILISAVRYCFQRETYMPSLTMDFVRRNMDYLTENTLNVLIRDITSELGHQPIFGRIAQKELWEKFLAELLDYVNKKGDEK